MNLAESDSEDELPPGWEERVTEDGSVFYANHLTKNTQWTHPRTGKKKIVSGELPFGWERCVDKSTGKIIYVDHENRRTTYTDPRLAFAIEEKEHVNDYRQRFDASSTALQVLHGRDLTGKVALVTGANAGIGYETTRSLAKHGCTVILACRNLDGARTALARIAEEKPSAKDSCECIHLDLSSLKSVSDFAGIVKVKYAKLDMVILNAGVFGLPYTKTIDNYETTFQVNHLSHFHLVNLVLPLLTTGARIIVVSSESHRYGSFTVENISPTVLSPESSSKYWDMTAYNNSKLCNVLFARHLAKKLQYQGCLAAFVEVTPREVLAMPYQNVSFLCKVAVPIQYCRMEVPGSRPLNLKPSIPPFEGIVYHGSGLQAGQCGVTIESVKDINNGEIKCTLGIESESEESTAVMHLVVAKPPRAPQLEILQTTDRYWAYKVGDVIHATCTIRDGRPVANISWYLDDELIPNSQLSPPTVISGTLDDLQTVYQNLTKKLQPSDNGRSLKCVSNHPANTANNVAYRQLNVTYAPIPQMNPIDKFGYILGKDGIISLIVEANPKPHLEWSIRDQVIKGGGHDSTGRIKAEELRDLGRGLYEAVLIIADIQKHDTETQYILKVYNDMGSCDYVILISTSPEPEDLELGVLSIIGIVVAVLILLLIVFLVIFARVTGRWCFSGPTGRHMRESSDTESVEVRPKNQTRLSLANLRFPSIFKKKDKLEDEEERPKSAETVETKVPLDEVDKTKEGIVYAELDLVNPNLKPLVKNYDDKTEYAEIVYAQKDNDEAENKA